jgi:hypothetical protein
VIVTDQLVTALVTGSLPTLAVLIGILLNNQRSNDFNQRFTDFALTVDVRFADTNRHIDDVRDLLRAEMFRMEQVIDARLKHLEERFQT